MATERAPNSTAAGAGDPAPPPPAQDCGGAGRRKIRVTVLGGVVAAGGLLALSQGILAVPPCPFRALTGLDCPFCGGTRAAMALLHGDIGAAADYNLLVTVAAFLAGGLFVWWLASLLRRSLSWPGPRLVRSRVVLITAVAVVFTFWFVRNLPFLPYLATAT